MPAAHEVLSQHQEAMPPWLAACTSTTELDAQLFGAMLGSRVVYYPGAGVNDGETFEVFTRSHAAHCVIHVDLSNSAQSVSRIVNRQVHGPYTHIAGYRPLVQKVFDRDEFHGLALLESHVAPADLPGAFWVILEREEESSDEHGPVRIAFLHVQCEAVLLFWKLWCRTGTPGPFAILLQDHGYGGNWTSFGADGELCRCAAAYEALPEWLLVDVKNRWPEYYPHSDKTPGGRMLHISKSGLGPKLISKETALSSPASAFIYARDVLKARWPEAEELIGPSLCGPSYLAVFPEAKIDWYAREWIDWTGL